MKSIIKHSIRTGLATLALTLGTTTSQADEGMWLMQQLKAQYPTMQARGLKLAQYDIYNPNGTSLKDAVVIFGRGCTGEVISNQGLVLTNHHCGYDQIRDLSSVQDNYLQDGFWAQSLRGELPAKGLTITFIESIEDVTAFVQKHLKKIKDPNDMSYLSPRYLAGLAELYTRKAKLAEGEKIEIKAFYNGNRYLLFRSKVYSDIRLVGTPPSSIGKFGADTDNWSYPRHTGDFSLFRIYADANGNPTDYSPSNQPLRPKRWLNISTQGVEEGDFAFIMGFPGRTNRFFLPEEVKEWQEVDNNIRIQMRGIREREMLAEMLSDPALNIKYAAKYASSQNGHKRAIGANWGINKNNLQAVKAQLMADLLKHNPAPRYQQAVRTIQQAIAERRALRTRQWYLSEGVMACLELLDALELAQASEDKVREFYTSSYDAKVDKRIALAILTAYTEAIQPEHWPSALREGLETYGSLSAYVSKLYQSSYTTAEGVLALQKGQSTDAEADQLVAKLQQSITHEYNALKTKLARFDNPILQARRTYVEGLLGQYGADQLWADANSTLRFTYGKVSGYKPRDGVKYGPQTYLDGVMQKEDSTTWEFVVPPRLKELFSKQSYGTNNRWAIQQPNDNWRMPVNFIATTHTTGGNSGSPVLNAKGQLIGINFDRTWEGVSGDIQYLPNYQRSIICDIRYILMIIEQVGQCPRLIEELSLVHE